MIKRVTDPDIIPGGSPANPEGDVLTVLPANVSATNGSIAYNATTQKWTFTPDLHFTGNARIDYLIQDGQGGTIPNSITLKVDSVNDAPVATFTTTQNTREGNAQISGQLTSTDVDLKKVNGTDDETATYSFVSAKIDDGASSTNVPAGLTINANGSWTFDATNAAYNGLALGTTKKIEVTYKVVDGAGGVGGTDTEKFIINVAGTNDDPVLGTKKVFPAQTEDTAFDILVSDLLVGYSDPDSDSLSVIGLSLIHI